MIEKYGKRCAFSRLQISGGFGCAAITEENCDGFNIKCGFYKTVSKYVSDRDRAIEISRQKGLCNKCKYGKSCRKSSEGGEIYGEDTCDT